MLKKILALSLLIMWLFQSLFSFLWYEVARQECRNEFFISKKKIVPNAITTVVIANNSPIDWEDDGNEILYNNTIYDVLSVEKNATFTLIKCVRDAKENILTEVYSKLKNKIEQHKKQALKKIKLIDVSTINQALHITYFAINSTVKHSSSTPLFYWGYTTEINPPPPKS